MQQSMAIWFVFCRFWDSAIIDSLAFSTGVMNRALMESGACIGTSQSPKCTLCPVSEHCRALQELTHRQHPVENEHGSLESKDTSDWNICVDLNDEIGDIEDVKVEMYPMKRAKTKVREQIVASLILIVGGDNDDQTAKNWFISRSVGISNADSRGTRTGHDAEQQEEGGCEKARRYEERGNVRTLDGEDHGFGLGGDCR